MKKIILDVDPGHDDAVAIMFAAASNEIDILGITCVAGNSILENTTQNALKICSFIDRTDINIYAGSNKPLKRKLVTASHVHGENGLEHSGDEIIIPNKYKLQEKDASALFAELGIIGNNKIEIFLITSKETYTIVFCLFLLSFLFQGASSLKYLFASNDLPTTNLTY